MKILVIFDSLYGNTKVVAKTIAKVLADEVIAIHDVVEKDATELQGLLLEAELVIFGSPTHGGRPKPAMQEFLDKIPDGFLTGKKAAAFDTRFLAKEQKLGLRVLMGAIGYAAPKILKCLEAHGAKPIKNNGDAVAGFIVQGKKGLFRDGELERAEAWARSLVL